MTSSGRTHSPDVVGTICHPVSSSHKSKMKALNAIGDTRTSGCALLSFVPATRR